MRRPGQDGPAAESAAGKLELELQAFGFGADEALHGLLTKRLRLDLERVGARLRQGGPGLSGALDLPPGRHRVRLSVRELGGDRVYARATRRRRLGARCRVGSLHRDRRFGGLSFGPACIPGRQERSAETRSRWFLV